MKGWNISLRRITILKGMPPEYLETEFFQKTRFFSIGLYQRTPKLTRKELENEFNALVPNFFQYQYSPEH